jgi:hypothetical protein
MLSHIASTLPSRYRGGRGGHACADSEGGGVQAAGTHVRPVNKPIWAQQSASMRLEAAPDAHTPFVGDCVLRHFEVCAVHAARRRTRQPAASQFPAIPTCSLVNFTT